MCPSPCGLKILTLYATSFYMATYGLVIVEVMDPVFKRQPWVPTPLNITIIVFSTLCIVFATTVYVAFYKWAEPKLLIPQAALLGGSVLGFFFHCMYLAAIQNASFWANTLWLVYLCFYFHLIVRYYSELQEECCVENIEAMEFAPSDGTQEMQRVYHNDKTMEAEDFQPECSVLHQDRPPAYCDVDAHK